MWRRGRVKEASEDSELGEVCSWNDDFVSGVRIGYLGSRGGAKLEKGREPEDGKS